MIMNGYLFPQRQHIHLFLLFLAVLSTDFHRAGALTASQQGAQPSLSIEAPTQVEVGDRIEIQLIIQNARDIAGYEAQLLFDTSVAHYSGLHQRDSDLKKFGRDVIPLVVTESPEGIAMGLASCPYPDCVEMKGTPQPRGANGKVRLGTVLIGTDQEGLLELSFAHLTFVDASGNVIDIQVPTTRVIVQVGPQNGATFTAPGSSWQWSGSPPTANNVDITGDGKVNYADAIEAAFEWTLSREQGQPCGPGNDLSRDVNGDGCIDVADIQVILANASGTRSQAQPVNPSYPNPNEPKIMEEAMQAAAALTFIVNSTGDADDSNIGDGVCASGSGCTLRAAISESNNHFGPDTVLFDIPGTGVQTIQLNSRLPSLWDGSGGTTIDGYSQPGAQANTNSLVSDAQIMIQIRGNGPSAFDAMLIQSAGNHIQGLSIFNARRSIWVYGSGARNNVVVGNFLGTNAEGTFGLTVHTLQAIGIELEAGATSNRVGGTSPAERNVLSGNARHGLDFNGEATDNNEVYNNLIGLNPAGTQRLENLRHGIDINAGPSNNIIGGTGPGQRNILSGNGENQNVAFTAGIEISHDTLTDRNQVIGNCIGTDPSCNTGPAWALNRHYGIRVEDGSNENIIANNVIGNHPFGGIKIDGQGTDLNQVYNNRVGISLNNSAIPNVRFGIQIALTSKSNRIGPNNIIANNGIGVELIGATTDRHTITQNSIFNNTSLGIDLTDIPGVTPNESGDGDTGSNQELNMPVLTTATTSSVTGTACADSVVSKPCRIEVFIAERRTSDNGGGNYGQGKTFVGSGTTAVNGLFTVSISGVTGGQYLTATATDAGGNTSEFSQNIQVSGGGGTTTYASDEFARNVVDSWGSADSGGSYTLTGTAANFDVNGSAGTIVVPVAGNARVAKLPNVLAQDLDFTFRVKTDKLAAGSNQSVFFIARSISNNTEYWCQLRIATTNTMYLRAVRVVNGTQTLIGTEVPVSGLTFAANTYIRMHGQVLGTNPTTIRLKAWADGQAEPGNWQFTVTDSAASLQTAGAVGIRTFLASGVTNAPVVFTFDDLLVTPP
jgi:CSLREA domain-containing protein